MDAVIGKTRKTAVLRIFQGTEQGGGSGNVAVVQWSLLSKMYGNDPRPYFEFRCWFINLEYNRIELGFLEQVVRSSSSGCNFFLFIIIYFLC